MCIKGQRKDPCGDGNASYRDCLNVNSLPVTLYFSFARSHNQWGKLGQGYTSSLCVIFLNC